MDSERKKDHLPFAHLSLKVLSFSQKAPYSPSHFPANLHPQSLQSSTVLASSLAQRSDPAAITGHALPYLSIKNENTPKPHLLLSLGQVDIWRFANEFSSIFPPTA